MQIALGETKTEGGTNEWDGESDHAGHQPNTHPIISRYNRASAHRYCMKTPVGCVCTHDLGGCWGLRHFFLHVPAAAFVSKRWQHLSVALLKGKKDISGWKLPLSESPLRTASSQTLMEHHKRETSLDFWQTQTDMGSGGLHVGVEAWFPNVVHLWPFRLALLAVQIKTLLRWNGHRLAADKSWSRYSTGWRETVWRHSSCCLWGNIATKFSV